MIRAVFLDVDDTLVDYAFAARNSFHATLGPDADYDVFTSLDHYERFLDGRIGFQAMRETRMRDYLALLQRDDDPVALEVARYAGLADHYRLFDDALPSVQALRRRGTAAWLDHQQRVEAPARQDRGGSASRGCSTR